MTYDEYWKQEYLSHGKWGYTNGVPNGKKKAKGLLDEANNLRNEAGKQIKKVGKIAGKQIDKVGNNVGYGTQAEIAKAKMRIKMAIASSKAKKGLTANSKKEPVNTRSTSFASIKKVNGKDELVFDNKKTKVSKRSAATANQYQKETSKIVKEYSKSTEKAAKKYGKDKQAEKDKNELYKDMSKKYAKVLNKASHQIQAGENQSNYEKEIIKKAKAVDKLRYPKKKK